MKKSFIEKHFDDDNPLKENDVDMNNSQNSSASMKVYRVLKPISIVGAFLLLLPAIFWAGFMMYLMIGGWIADAKAYNGTGDAAEQYGKETFRYYKVFNYYN